MHFNPLPNVDTILTIPPTPRSESNPTSITRHLSSTSLGFHFHFSYWLVQQLIITSGRAWNNRMVFMRHSLSNFIVLTFSETPTLKPFNYQKADNKIFICKTSEKKTHPSYILFKIQGLEGKQCRFRWGGSLWATSSGSTLFANLSVFVSSATAETVDNLL